MPRLTIMIAARNAVATIERAVASAVTEGVPLLLIDDHSTDATVARARAVAGSRLRVVSTPAPGGLPVARQRGLDTIATDFGAWLDADDEWLPGRARRLASMLDSGCDVAVDTIELHDGPTGTWLKRLTAPRFLTGPRGSLRLFERNWLPGDSQVGFRTSTFRRAGGYDPNVFGPESYDIILRAVARGASFAWSQTVGYRMFAYPHSVSRQIARQRAALTSVLRRHEYETIRDLYRQAGYPPRIRAWALVGIALYRSDPDAALRFIHEASPPDSDPVEVLEPRGPWPFSEGWRRAFARGVSLLLLGDRDEEARAAFRTAESISPTAEGANNLGVALARLRMPVLAQGQWLLAAQRFPGYADARRNLTDGPRHITTHPLRRWAARNEYCSA